MNIAANICNQLCAIFVAATTEIFRQSKYSHTNETNTPTDTVTL